MIISKTDRVLLFQFKYFNADCFHRLFYLISFYIDLYFNQSNFNHYWFQIHFFSQSKKFWTVYITQSFVIIYFLKLEFLLKFAKPNIRKMLLLSWMTEIPKVYFETLFDLTAKLEVSTVDGILMKNKIKNMINI